MDLRYGMNPHQAARAWGIGAGPVRVLAGAPSYINMLDALNAWHLVREADLTLGQPVAASFKHVSPAGVACAGRLDDAVAGVWGLSGSEGPLTSAYARARDADPKSSYGDMIAISRVVDVELADLLSRVVSDGIIAPGFAEGTVALLANKKRGTFLIFEADQSYQPPVQETREVFGIRLEQDVDRLPITAGLLKVAHGRPLAPAAIDDALLGMVTLRYTQSNSVAYVRDGMTVGVGAGQQSRIDCTKLAGAKTAVWWMRRHPSLPMIPFRTDLPRQERVNWQVRCAEGDLTAAEHTFFQQALVAPPPPLPDAAQRRSWMRRLDGVTLTSDGHIPFRDNIDAAARYDVGNVVEPGGSHRSPDVARACASHGITLVHTGLRLFHH